MIDPGLWLLPVHVQRNGKQFLDCWPYEIDSNQGSMVFVNQFDRADVLPRLRVDNRRGQFIRWFNLNAGREKLCLRAYWDTENLCPTSIKGMWDLIDLVLLVAMDCGFAQESCVIVVFHRQASFRKMSAEMVQQLQAHNQNRGHDGRGCLIEVEFVGCPATAGKSNELDLRLGVRASSDLTAFQESPFVCLILSSDCDFSAIYHSPSATFHSFLCMGQLEQRSSRLVGQGYGFIPIEGYCGLLRKSIPELLRPRPYDGGGPSDFRNIPKSGSASRSMTPRRSFRQDSCGAEQMTVQSVQYAFHWGHVLQNRDAELFSSNDELEDSFMRHQLKQSILHYGCRINTDIAVHLPFVLVAKDLDRKGRLPIIGIDFGDPVDKNWAIPTCGFQCIYNIGVVKRNCSHGGRVFDDTTGGLIPAIQADTTEFIDASWKAVQKVNRQNGLTDIDRTTTCLNGWDVMMSGQSTLVRTLVADCEKYELFLDSQSLFLINIHPLLSPPPTPQKSLCIPYKLRVGFILTVNLYVTPANPGKIVVYTV